MRTMIWAGAKVATIVSLRQLRFNL